MEQKLYRFCHLIIKVSRVRLIHTCQCRRHKRLGFDLWVGKIPWSRAWQHSPVFSPGESPWTEEPGGLQSMLSCFSSVESLSHVWLFETPWIAAHQASLSITNSRSSPKLMCIESVMPSSYLILCRSLLLLPPIPPSIRVFSNESTLPMRWPKYWSFSLSISPSMNTQDWSPLGWTGWISLQSKGLSRVFSNTTVQKHQCLGAQLSSQSNSHVHTWLLEKP